MSFKDSFKSAFWPLTEPVAISEPAVANDLRFGSELVNDLPAAPSLYGLHSYPLTPLTTTLGGRPLSYARIYASQPWVYTAVQRLLTWAARVPLKAYIRTGEDSRERLYDHPLAQAIVSPWERGAQVELIHALLGPLLIHGNGVVMVDEGRSGKIAFRPRDWRYLTPILATRSTIAGWESVEDDDRETFGADTAIHAHWYSPSGPIGVSPLQALSVTIDIEDATRRFTASTMKNSARPPSAITVSEDFLGRDPDERKAIVELVREQITAIYSGPENAGKAAILPFGLDWKQVGHTAVETQLIEQRKIAREEVAAVYQIPPPMIGILDHATYSNMAQMREMSYTDALGPFLVLLEQQINAQLVRGLMRLDDLYVEFDFAGVLRGDRLKEVQAIREAINTGVLTPNEGRTALNYPKSDDEAADSLYLSTNNLEPLATVLDPEEETPPPVPPPPSE